MKSTKPEEKDSIYNYLKKNYYIIKEAYRYLSSLNPSGNIWSIGTNVFSDVIFNCGTLVDYKTLKLSDVDLEFITTKASGLQQFKTRTNPERQIIRF